MKKALIIATAAAFLGGTFAATTPASAMFFALPFVLQAKKNPNFKAQNPYAKKSMKKKSAKKKM